MTGQPQEAVVLVHGLWMRGWTWHFYRRWLTQQGYKVYLFSYKTTQQAFDLTLLQLAAFVNSRPERIMHLVVHSMGGILAMRALPKINKPGKLVMLGSPINGSKVAKKLQRIGWHKGLLNHATDPLTQGTGDVDKLRESLMIAGTSAYGFGRLIEARMGVSDGTVGLAETQADWLDEHVQIHCNHMGLLWNKQAMNLTLDFLRKS